MTPSDLIPDEVVLDDQCWQQRRSREGIAWDGTYDATLLAIRDYGLLEPYDGPDGQPGVRLSDQGVRVAVALMGMLDVTEVIRQVGLLIQEGALQVEVVPATDEPAI